MKLSCLAMSVMMFAVLCAPSPSKAGDAPEKQAAAGLHACHGALLSLYYYPYLTEFGEIDANSSRIVKDSSKDALTDIIVVPSSEPAGYWAYEHTGARYFFPVAASSMTDNHQHYYKLQVGRRAVYINADSRDQLGEPLLQPTASLSSGKSPYATIRAASRFDESAFQLAVETDINDNALARACSHHARELSFAAAEPTEELTRQDSGRADGGIRAAVSACAGVASEKLNRSAMRGLLACGLTAGGAPGALAAQAREDQSRDGKAVAASQAVGGHHAGGRAPARAASLD